MVLGVLYMLQYLHHSKCGYSTCIVELCSCRWRTLRAIMEVSRSHVKYTSTCRQIFVQILSLIATPCVESNLDQTVQLPVRI